MKLEAPLFRLWTDLIGLLIPLVAIVLYVVDGPSALTMALSLVSIAAIVGTRVATSDLGSWRAGRAAGLRRLRSRMRGRGTAAP